MAIRVFDDIARSDAKPARHGERRFDFLNRSAAACFGGVRDLIEEWFARYPADHKADLRGRLRSDNLRSEAAFWELYLHEAFRRSDYVIEVHPDVPSRSTRPDFRVAFNGHHFFLEAVSVGRDPASLAKDRRLDEVYRILHEMKVEDFAIGVSTFAVGPEPLSTRGLRDRLRSFLAGLDPDQATADVEAAGDNGVGSLPGFEWWDAGWRLQFQAFPLREETRGVPRSALGLMGPGEAFMVDNVSGLRRVLAAKRGRYGSLDAPLVIAVQSNTDYPTDDDEVERALYGLCTVRPRENAQGAGHRLEEGLWIGATGWRNADTPQVLSIYGLAPWAAAWHQPRCWNTLEPDVALPVQPAWLASMVVGATGSKPGTATPMAEHFGLTPDWPGKPDFDLS